MATYLHSQLNTFRNDGKYCDVIIRVQDDEFRCHRVVLAAFSEYFDAMFSGAFKESYISEITLHDVKACPFKAILDYAYTGCEPNLNRCNILDILKTSNFLGDFQMVNICIEYLRCTLSELNNVQIVQMYRFACNVNETHLLKILAAHILENLRTYAENSDVLQMSLDEIKILLEEHKKFDPMFTIFWNVKDTDLIFDVILRWVYHSHKERALFFEELIGFVDLKFVSAEYVTSLSKEFNIEYSAEKSFKECLINHVVSCELDKETLPVPVFQGILSSSMSLSTVHVFFNSLRKNIKLTGIFSLNEREPRECKVLLTESKNLSRTARSVALKDNLYFFGCDYSEEFSLSSFRISSSASLFQNQQNRLLTHPPCKSGEFEMCGTNNNGIYWYNSNLHNSEHYKNLPDSWRPSFSEEQIYRGIYRYDCELDRWYSVPEMRRTLANSCLVTDDNRIYLIGGNNINSNRSEQNLGGYVQALDYRAPEWQELPKTNNSNRNAVCCVMNEKIYVSDANNYVPVLEMYDSVAGKWEVIKCHHDASHEEMMFPFVPTVKRMVSFKNLLWLWSSSVDYCPQSWEQHFNFACIINPYEKTSSNIRSCHDHYSFERAICLWPRIERDNGSLIEGNDGLIYDHHLFDPQYYYPQGGRNELNDVTYLRLPDRDTVRIVDAVVFKCF